MRYNEDGYLSNKNRAGTYEARGVGRAVDVQDVGKGEKFSWDSEDLTCSRRDLQIANENPGHLV